MKWLGWLAVLLLLANGGLYAYTQLNASRHGETLVGHEPIHGDKIKFATADEIKSQEQEKEKKEAEQASVVKALICKDWSGIAADDVERAKKSLDKMGLTDSMTALTTPTSYWAYIPPLKTMKDAEKKLGEVKDLGIEDNVRIEEKGKWRFAINLGMFATEDEAKKYLEQLKSKGVKSAKSGRRGGGNEIVGWHIQNVDDQLATQLDKLQSDFSGSELKPAQCN